MLIASTCLRASRQNFAPSSNKSSHVFVADVCHRVVKEPRFIVFYHFRAANDLIRLETRLEGDAGAIVHLVADRASRIAGLGHEKPIRPAC